MYMPFALYTEDELRAIHRNFGHPSIRATEGLLKRAEGGVLDAATRSSIAQIATECKMCNTYGKAPRRFKLTVGADGLRFNHSVQVNTMFVHGKPVLHMVEVATHFLRREVSPDEICQINLALHTNDVVFRIRGPARLFLSRPGIVIR